MTQATHRSLGRGKAAQLALLVIVGMGVLSSAGCLWAGAAVGAKFMTSDADGVLEASPQQVADAAKAVLRDEGLTIVEDRVDPNGEIEIEGESDEGRTVRLKIDPVGSGAKLNVRSGLLGDKDEAQYFFGKIKQRLE